MRKVIIVIATCAALALAALSPRGRDAAASVSRNWNCCDFSLLDLLRLTKAKAYDGTRFYSEIGQDKWVLIHMFPNARSGYFLDVGSGPGTIGSNSKALEERGWTGICVDPFPTQMQGRTCTMVREVVSNASGQVVRFHTDAGLGGIADTLGKWKEQASKSPVVELTTVTVGEILERTKAPAFINFLSIDIEGAELQALQGIPFDKYHFGAMAIEHNEEEPKRTDILNFLKSKGYERVHSYRQDDFYAPQRSDR
jgi:hypothetical protein